MTKFKVYKLYSKKPRKKRILLGWRRIRKKPIAAYTAALIAFHAGFAVGYFTLKVLNN